MSLSVSLDYRSSRILYGLSLRGSAPAFFSKTLKNGLPVTAIATSVSFGLLSFMALSEGAST